VAVDKINVTYTVKEDGSLGKIAKGAEKAAKSTDKASKATAGHNKQQKGVAGLTSNSTKGFSKMTTGITGGLVPAYATLAANVFALTAAFGLLSRNDAISKLNEGLVFTGNAAGQNLTLVADKLKEITDNAISAEQAMRATAVGVSAGFDQSQIENLARVAKGASLALGRDMGDAMDRLIRGAAKLEPEILDELGIMVRLDDATRQYAASMNKAVGELTQFERRMAFTNAVIEDGLSKFQDIAGAVEASPYTQLSASFSDLTKSGVQLLNTALTPIISFLANNMAALGVVMIAFGLTISRTLLSTLTEMAAASALAASATANQSVASLKALKPNAALGKVYNRIAKAGIYTTASINSMTRSLTASIASTKVDVAATRQAVLAKRQLQLALYAGTLATHQDSAAKALNMIETHGLSLAFKAHMLVLAEAAATTTAATVGTDFYTTSLIRLKFAGFAASASLKFLGAALMAYMPWIIGIMMALTLLGPMIMSLFTPKEDKLSKQLETNTERLEALVGAMAQYNRSIKKASSATESWHRTIKPLSGIFDQMNQMMNDTAIAAETVRILANAKALKELMVLEKEREARNVINRDIGSPEEDASYKEIGLAQSVKDTMTLGERERNAVREESIKAIAAGIASMNQMIVTLESEEEKTGLHAQALAMVNDNRTKAQVILDRLVQSTDDSSDATERERVEFEKLSNTLKTGLKAYENFNEIVTKAKALAQTGTYGEMADEIDNVKEAVNSLDAILAKGSLGNDAAQEQAYEIVKAYGLYDGALEAVSTTYDETGKLVLKDIYGKIITLDHVGVVKNFQIELAKVNQGFKDLEVMTARSETLSSILGSDSDFAYAAVLATAKRSLELEIEKMGVTVKGGAKEHEQALAILEIERELLGLSVERMKVLAGRAKSSGMGQAAEAAISGVGKSAAIKSASVTVRDKDTGEIIGDPGTFDNEDDQNAALAANRAETAKNSLAGVAKQMAELGPEGALMSSAIEGAMNMSTAFSTAFEVMNNDAATTGEKVTAGLGAIGAALSAVSAMQKASSADKIRAIDGEIAAEKQRDGSSEASLAKISALEKKKDKEARKAFEQEKKMKMAQTIISTAQGAIAAYTSMLPIPIVGPALGAAAAAMVVAMGAKQLSAISSSTYQGGGSISGAGGQAKSISVGSRGSSVDLASSQSAGGELGYMRGDSGAGGIDSFKPAFSGYKHRAGGGYVVGEQGPEVFMPETPGNIIPAGQGMGGTTNVNFSIQAVDASGVEDLLINQRGNLIGMMREAANSYGQDFMEGVDTSVYTPSTAGATRY
tara:strand:- start:9432 stop:13325 length:3894 start_codon:yes stop_codon:yes gene_type:complete